MEQENKIQRSDFWKQIYKVVSQIPRNDCEGDAKDAMSVATELEELFAIKKREMLIAYANEYLEGNNPEPVIMDKLLKIISERNVETKNISQ